MPIIVIQDMTGGFGVDVNGSIATAKRKARQYLKKGFGMVEYKWFVDATFRVLSLDYAEADDPHICDVSIRLGDGDLTEASD